MKTRKKCLWSLLAAVVSVVLGYPGYSQGNVDFPRHELFRKQIEKFLPQKPHMETGFPILQQSLSDAKQNKDGVIYFADSVISYANMNGNMKDVYMHDPSGNETDHYSYLWENNNWINNSHDVYTYDENGNRLSYINLFWDGAAWQNSYQEFYTYDAYGNMLTMLSQSWDNGWVNSFLYTLTYDENGLLLNALGQFWDGATWVNSDYLEVTWPAADTKVTTWYGWDGTGWNFLNERYTETYDESGNMLTYLSESGYSGAWENSYFDTYTYDENGHWLTFLEQLWSGTWDNYSLITRTYDPGGNMLTNLNQEWQGAWVDMNFATFTYDPDGNQLSALYQVRIGGSWVNSAKVEYGYAEGFIYGDAFNWDGSAWYTADWQIELGLKDNSDYYRFFANFAYYAEAYYSSLIINVDEHAAENTTQLTIYPNPASGMFSVKTGNAIGTATITMFDLSGKKVDVLYKGTITPNMDPIVYNTPTLVPGIYIVELQAGTFTTRQKVVIKNQ